MESVECMGPGTAVWLLPPLLPLLLLLSLLLLLPPLLLLPCPRPCRASSLPSAADGSSFHPDLLTRCFSLSSIIGTGIAAREGLASKRVAA